MCIALSTRSINTPTDKQPLDQSTRERAAPAPARSRLYRYFYSSLSFLFGAPLLHPTYGLFKVSRRRARACACAMLRAMLANRLLRALHRPCCQTAYVYTRVHIYVYTRTHMSPHSHTHVDTAILRRSANQWRNCKPVHPRGPSVVHAAWISNLSPSLISSFFPFFHSIAFHRFTGCPRLYA